jgi:hypothetical protein
MNRAATDGKIYALSHFSIMHKRIRKSLDACTCTFGTEVVETSFA